MPRKESTVIDAAMKKRRKRTAFNHEQQTKLEIAFQKDHWPTRTKKERLAEELDMSLQSVRTWFQNRRAKEKREEDMREFLSAKEKSAEKKHTATKPFSQMKGKDENIKSTSSGSPSHMLTASHSFVTRSKLKKEIRVKELQHTVQPTYGGSGSELSERMSEEEEEEDGSTAEDDTEAGEAEKSVTEQSSDSSPEENNKEPNTCKQPSDSDPSKQYVKHCQTEGEIVMAKYSPRVCADIFTTLIDMMCVVEGGIIRSTDTSFSTAANHAMYGIHLKQGETLLYDKSYGFYFDQSEEK